MNNLDSFVKEFNKNYIQKELTENEILFDNIDEKKLDIQQREIIATADAHQATRIDAELSMAALREYREKFPAWQDADEFRLW